MVNVEEIKTAIEDREEELKEKFEKENIINRDEMDKVEKFINTDIALIISGVRRCGKSVLAFMLGEDKNYGYVNFEDERLSMEGKDLNKVLEALYSLKGDPELIIFDEIQNIDGWEKFIARNISNKKIVITGSNARLLSKELATHLTGRHIDYTLFPFSFKEYLKLKGFSPDSYSTKNKVKLRKFFDEYMEKGGFPLTHKIGKIFLSENYKDIIERDAVQRYNIRHTKSFKDMARHLISNATNEITYNKLKEIFDIKSSHTAKSYFSYLENSYLIFSLNRFSYKLKEQMKAPKKVYCMDTGMLDSMGFRFSPNRGKFLENLLAIELLRKTSHKDDLELYYWKDHKHREVDFVIKDKEEVKKLVQVTYASSEKEVKERETDSLLKASEDLKCNNLIIITYDYEDRKKIDGKEIKFFPCWKYLLKS